MANSVIDILVKVGLLDDRQHDSALSRSKSGAGGHIVQQIADLGYATESTIARALSVELGLPRVDLSITPPEHEAIALLDLRTCLDRFVLPVALRESGEMLWLAMGDPTDSESMAVVRRKTNKRVRPVVAGPSEILREARRLYQSPATSGSEPEMSTEERLKAIELKDVQEGNNEAFEIVNVGDDSAAPLQRLAEQLGVEVPQSIARRHQGAAGGDGVEIDLSGAAPGAGDETLLGARPAARQNGPGTTSQGMRALSAPGPGATARGMRPVGGSAPTAPRPSVPPPRPAPRASAPPPSSPRDDPATTGELFALPPPSALTHDDFAAADLHTLEALRSSMEKAALVLRAVAELCVERGVFTGEEMRSRSR